MAILYLAFVERLEYNNKRKTMKTTILTTITIALTAALLTGCGGGSLAGEVSNVEDTLNDAKDEGSPYGGIDNGVAQDKSKIEMATYAFENDRVLCNKPGARVDQQKRVTCTWYCGDYEGARPVTVMLSFKRTNYEINGAWQLESDLVLTAAGGCHD